MTAKISVFAICVKVIIYLHGCNLQFWRFINIKNFIKAILFSKNATVYTYVLYILLCVYDLNSHSDIENYTKE